MQIFALVNHFFFRFCIFTRRSAASVDTKPEVSVLFTLWRLRKTEPDWVDPTHSPPGHLVAQDGVSCVRSVSADQAPPSRCQELITVDAVLCTVPWAKRVGALSPWRAQSVVRVGPGWGGGWRGGFGGVITKHAADSSGTKAALTSSLLVASVGRSRSALSRLTRTTSHHS